MVKQTYKLVDPFLVQLIKTADLNYWLEVSNMGGISFISLRNIIFFF